MQGKKILVAPLDWGLGHATRCVPLINELLLQGHSVILAAEKAGFALLHQEFPSLQIIPLQGYNVSYSKKKYFFLLKIFTQLYSIKKTINREHNWLQKIIALHNIDVVISDNRFGLQSKNAHCIFITHQLLVKTGIQLLDFFTQKMNYHFINKFNECWVPDVENNENLAGELSHPKKMPTIVTTYIGVLSRFTKKTTAFAEKIDVLVVLSGPEPQRTIFENALLPQLQALPLKTMLVRGLPNSTNTLQYPNVTVVQHLSATDLNKILLAADTIITRCGYSTILDLVALQKTAIVVPTPGQTEQEYLAKYLSLQQHFYTAPQKNFNIAAAIAAMQQTKILPFNTPTGNQLADAIKNLPYKCVKQ